MTIEELVEVVFSVGAMQGLYLENQNTAKPESRAWREV
jgi:hypothetical protein